MICLSFRFEFNENFTPCLHSSCASWCVWIAAYLPSSQKYTIPFYYSIVHFNLILFIVFVRILYCLHWAFHDGIVLHKFIVSRHKSFTAQWRVRMESDKRLRWWVKNMSHVMKYTRIVCWIYHKTCLKYVFSILPERNEATVRLTHDESEWNSSGSIHGEKLFETKSANEQWCHPNYFIQTWSIDGRFYYVFIWNFWNETRLKMTNWP